MKYKTLDEYKEAIGVAHTKWIRGDVEDELALFKLISESWQFVSKTDVSMHFWAGFTSVFAR